VFVTLWVEIGKQLIKEALALSLNLCKSQFAAANFVIGGKRRVTGINEDNCTVKMEDCELTYMS